MLKKIGFIVFLGVALLFILASPSSKPAVISHGTTTINSRFTLLDTKNNLVRDTDFEGKPMLIYMGYTFCPDLCPTTLSLLSTVMTKLGKANDQIAVIFISLDPARDTPQVLSRYLKAYDPRIIGLTGSPEALRETTANFKAPFEAAKIKSGQANYQLDHSGFIYLFDKKGEYVTHFEPDTAPDAIIAKVKTIMEQPVTAAP